MAPDSENSSCFFPPQAHKNPAIIIIIVWIYIFLISMEILPLFHIIYVGNVQLLFLYGIG